MTAKIVSDPSTMISAAPRWRRRARAARLGKARSLAPRFALQN
jgi:hypothetical protein